MTKAPNPLVGWQVDRASVRTIGHELLRPGGFPFDRLVKCYALDEVSEAVTASSRGEVLKAIVRLVRSGS